MTWPRYYVLLAAATLLLLELGLFPGRRVGYACSDPALSSPYRGDSVPTSALLLVTFALPLPLLWAAECAGGTRGPWAALRAAAAGHRELAVGGGLVLLLTDVLKHVVAAPRPHFLDTCRPADCTVGMAAEGGRHVGLDACTRTDASPRALRDAARSFPSGHAALSVYAALWGVCYLRGRRRPPSRSSSLLMLLQYASLVAWAALCSVSRVVDRRHHWWDVLAGAALGGGVAAFVVGRRRPRLLHGATPEGRR